MADSECGSLHMEDVYDCQNKPVSMPINAVARIFYFLSRDEIEICKQVCRSWYDVIVLYNKKLPKRKIDVLWLSSCYEYGAILRYGSRAKRIAFKKYFRYRDIKSGKTVKNIVARGLDDLSHFPCMRLVPGPTTPLQPRPFAQFDHMHEHRCKNILPLLYDRINNYQYEKKIFTPPYEYYQCIKEFLKDCEVQSLVFCKFTFTDFFVEKFVEFFAQDGPFRVEQVTLHNCNVRYVHSPIFHQLLGDHIQADRYFIECLQYCLPATINMRLIRKPNIRRASIFFVGQCFARHDRLQPARFSVTDEEFLSYIDELIREEKRCPSQIERRFFGISQSNITEFAVNRFKRIYDNADRYLQSAIYGHIIFDRWRYVGQPKEAAEVVQLPQPAEDWDTDEED